MIRLPGLGIAKGMAFTLVQFFRPKATVQYPEVVQDISPKHRGRLLLLYDEYGALKCETCFQCAMACPIEVIDMGGVDTKNRFHVHWGPPEQYDERREESALRRSGRVVPDAAFVPFQPIDLRPLDGILADEDYDPKRMLAILERAQAAYGFLPVAAVRHIAHQTGAWYSEIYGIASFYQHLRLEPAGSHVIAVCRCPSCSLKGGGRLREALEVAVGSGIGTSSPEGTVRLVAGDCNGEPDRQPYLTVDGELQQGLDAAALTRLVARLRGQPAHEARV